MKYNSIIKSPSNWIFLGYWKEFKERVKKRALVKNQGYFLILDIIWKFRAKISHYVLWMQSVWFGMQMMFVWGSWHNIEKLFMSVIRKVSFKYVLFMFLKSCLRLQSCITKCPILELGIKKVWELVIWIDVIFI